MPPPTIRGRIHVFAKGGHEPRTVLVKAGSELEARGKMSQHGIFRTSNFEYKGLLEDLIIENGDVFDPTGVDPVGEEE